MPLFLDRLPLYSWVDESHYPVIRRWSVSLPALLTEPKAGPPVVNAQPHRWVFDPGYTGEAFAWRSHLLEAGLNLTTGLAGSALTRTALGTEERLIVRKAGIWLVSNLPSFRDHPFRVALLPGVAVHDAVVSNAEFHRPLLGMRALLRAGLKVRIDFARATVSVWTPGPWWENLALFARRLGTGFTRLPPPW